MSDFPRDSREVSSCRLNPHSFYGIPRPQKVLVFNDIMRKLACTLPVLFLTGC